MAAELPDGLHSAPRDNPLRYRAFISYSHRDAAIARRLHRALEAFRLPRGVVVGRRAMQLPGGRLRPVFLDREELASSGALSNSLQAALDGSEALIVVCSPAAVASRWVNEEILHFRSRYPQRPVFAFVAGGDPGVDPRVDAAAALPLRLALAVVTEPDGALAEPIAADARASGDGFALALLKLCAGLLDVRFDELRRRELHRRQRQWALVAAGSLLLSAVFAGLAWQATLARDDARAARERAELELQSEQQTRQFLLSVFELADAGEARGNSVTVREVLDKAVARIDATPFARPAIKSRFLASMGKAYGSLGLNRRSVELLRSSLAALPEADASAAARAQRIDSQLDLASVQHVMGDYADARKVLAAARAAIDGGTAAAVQRARAAYIEGDILSRDGDAVAAARAFAQALELANHASIGREERVLLHANSELGLAFIDYDAGRHDDAERHFAAALDMLLPVFGETHPLFIVAISSRGANAYAGGDVAIARSAWQRSLALSQRVYDPDGPEIGTIKNNLGRLLLETGDLDAAVALLRDALATDRRHRSEQFDDLVYSLHNLAYAEAMRGNTTDAVLLLREALPIAEKRQHVMLGAILNALADVECQIGPSASSVATATRAQEIQRKRVGVEHWLSSQATVTVAYCVHRSGQAVDRAALRADLQRLTTKWGKHGSFARRANQQWREISG